MLNEVFIEIDFSLVRSLSIAQCRRIYLIVHGTVRLLVCVCVCVSVASV